jgi:ribosome-binding factor A
MIGRPAWMAHPVFAEPKAFGRCFFSSYSLKTIEVGMKHRLERVNEVIRRELSEIVSREINFTPETLVTIHAVAASQDLRQCQVYVSVIGKPEQKARVLLELEDRRVSLQRELSKRVVLKYTPHLNFKLDNSIERGSRVLEIMQDLDIPRDDR